jgi:hypothetical protein
MNKCTLSTNLSPFDAICIFEMLATNTTTNLNIICAHSCYCPFFSLSALGLIHLIIQKRWMMLRNPLDPCYASFGLVMDSLLFLTSPKPAWKDTNCVWVTPMHVWAPPDTSWTSKRAGEQKRNPALLCTTCNNNCAPRKKPWVNPKPFAQLFLSSSLSQFTSS